MFTWSSGQRKVAQMQKTWRHKRVATICVALTLIMICSLLMDKDLSVFQTRFLSSSNCPNQLLEELKDSSSNNKIDESNRSLEEHVDELTDSSSNKWSTESSTNEKEEGKEELTDSSSNNISTEGKTKLEEHADDNQEVKESTSNDSITESKTNVEEHKEELKDSSSNNSTSDNKTNLEDHKDDASSNKGSPVPEIDPKLYDSVDLEKLLDQDEQEDNQEPKKPYSLGPKISDWDEQRANWLKNNPQFPNYIQPNKPRVLLVTGSSHKPCENRVGDHYLLKSIKNKIDYCRIHGIEVYYNMALLDAEMTGFWAKLPLIRKLLLSHPEVELLWWMDSDAMFTDMAFELPWERYKDANFIVHGFKDLVYDNKSWVGLNTGSFLLRNTQWALDLLDVWAPMGPKGKGRDEAGEFLTKQLPDRPHFEADDQSAMVYLLVSQREKWGNKVYLEKTYFLHGYWVIIVDKYEQFMEKYHPGFGDKRWPFVTHFTGCKPCGKFSNYPAERCLKQMERAYNFGDNQILRMYGFSHKSLASRSIVRLRQETSKPLEFKDEYGLLHPSFKAVQVGN